MKLLLMYMKIIENYPQRKKIITNVGKEKCKGRFFLQESHQDFKSITVWVFPTILSYI